MLSSVVVVASRACAVSQRGERDQAGSGELTLGSDKVVSLRRARRRHAECSDREAVAASAVNVELSEWRQRNSPKGAQTMDNRCLRSQSSCSSLSPVFFHSMVISRQRIRMQPVNVGVKVTRNDRSRKIEENLPLKWAAEQNRIAL